MSPSLSMKIVLIAENGKSEREQLLKHLSCHPGLNSIDTASDGKEALTKLMSKQYDLALINTHLPLLSGLEVVKRLEKVPYIILYSSSGDNAVKAFDVGVRDYIVKPVTRDRLYRAIERFLKRAKNCG